MRLIKLPKWHPVITPASERENVVLLKGQLPSHFPLINSPYLAWLPGSLFISLHSPYILVLKSEPGREDPPQLGGLLSWAHLQWSPSLDLAKKLRRAPGWSLHSPCWTDIHTLAHISPGYKGEWNPIVSAHSLSLSPCFQVLALGGRIPMVLGFSALWPVWLWNRGRPFQRRLLLLSGKVQRTGMPFLSDISPHFLLPLSNLPIQPQWEILNPNPQNLLL